MTDDIKTRLQDSATECLKCFDAWNGNKKDAPAREALHDAVHELRKVASRLEIEMAVSERDEGAQKQIPIPHHRDAKGRHQNADDDQGPGNQADDGKSVKTASRSRRRSSGPKKASGGEG